MFLTIYLKSIGTKLTALLFFALLFSQCQKTDSSQPISPDKVSSVCLLTKYQLEGSTSTGTTYTSNRSFLYNTDQLPVQVRYIYNNQYSDTDTLIYDSKKRLTLIRNTRANGVINYEFSLKYNNDSSTPSSYTRTHVPSGIVIVSTLTFNTNNQLTQDIITSALFETVSFIYDINKNLQRSNGSYADATPSTIPKRDGMAFDTNNNPWSSSIPLQLWAYIRLNEYTAFSTNNPTKDTFTNSIGNANGMLTYTSYDRVYNYKYNEYKYPTQQIMSSKQDNIVYSYDYKCQ
ncbi:hypothetical protein [Spirosoma sp. 48-14]|uniref:hypothetical protein n=2 Tax=unclassified Spirosoma TaxID=2621999 RepID=UPI000A603BFB|nr:hypothetical protein [Spirosoma sp. 48-14]